MDIKQRKIKSIKLNPEKEVRFYNIDGLTCKASRVVIFCDLREGRHTYFDKNGVSSTRLAVGRLLTDYGVQEYEAQNILVEFEDDGILENFNKLAKESNSTPFKTELPDEYVRITEHLFMQKREHGRILSRVKALIVFIKDAVILMKRAKI